MQLGFGVELWFHGPDHVLGSHASGIDDHLRAQQVECSGFGDMCCLVVSGLMEIVVLVLQGFQVDYFRLLGFAVPLSLNHSMPSRNPQTTFEARSPKLRNIPEVIVGSLI